MFDFSIKPLVPNLILGSHQVYHQHPIAMKYINTLHSIITIGSSYIFRNNYDTYLQFHIVYCRDVIQHKVKVTTSQLHMMLLV